MQKMEPPFTGYLIMHEDVGAYHCAKCKSELFHSSDKFYSGSGYASFMKGQGLSIESKEVFCNNCKGFLGKKIAPDSFSHTNYRYDINSAALSFIPQ